MWVMNFNSESSFMLGDRPMAGRLTERGATRTEDAQGAPTQSHMSPSILAYE